MTNSSLIILLVILIVIYLLLEKKSYSGHPLSPPPPKLPKPKDKTYLKKYGPTIIHPNGTSTTTYLINQEG